MTLRDINTRYAALKLIADAVKDAMDREKAAHLEALEQSSNDSGAKSWTVTIDDQKVASLTLSQRAAAPRVADESALIDAISEAHPEMLEHAVSLKPWASKQLLDSIIDVTDDGAVTKDGELLPGIVMSEPGAPYQSLRWDKATGETKGDERGRHFLADAIRSGELSELLADAGLPMIGGTQ